MTTHAPPPRYWEEFIPRLRCPLTREDLVLAEPRDVGELIRHIDNNQFLQPGKQPVIQTTTSYLRTRHSDIFYPVFSDDILGLLPFLAIAPADHPIHNNFSDPSLSNSVRHYYEDVGWKKSAEETFIDTERSVSMKEVARQYHGWCHDRLDSQIPRGTFLLDIASGSIPHDEYLKYHDGFQFRICIDFSRAALELARHKIGQQGIFILGDATRLPLGTNSVDTTISLHTVYHIPSALQETAVREFQRVSTNSVLIVYTWDSSLMNFLFSLTMFVGKWRRLGKTAPAPGKAESTNPADEPELYIHSYPDTWWKRNWPASLRIRCWSSVSRTFLDKLIPDNGIGRFLLRILFFFEGLFPRSLGKWGPYPLLILTPSDEANETDRSVY